MAELTGGEPVEVPEDDEVSGEEAETTEAEAADVDAGVTELLEAVGVNADEYGVDAEREIAGEG
jgi:hypothetical protein